MFKNWCPRCGFTATLLCFASCGGGGEAKPTETKVDASLSCTGSSAADLMECVDQDRLSADIDAIALERMPGSSHWQSVQDLCRIRLEDAGYEVELHTYGTGVNVIGRLPGTDPDSGDVIVSAHYDHIGGCPGADDNASSVAGALEIARLLTARESRRPLVIACWDEEEGGLIGSKAYAERAKQDGNQIAAMISLEGIGYRTDEPNTQGVPAGFDLLFPDQNAELASRQFTGDFILLIADESSAGITERFVTHSDSIGLKEILLPVPEGLKLSDVIGDLRRSDHASFWFQDYPGIMVSDTANFRNPNYHCFNGIDLPSTLDMDFVRQVTQATLGATIDIMDAL